jgi:2-oxoisovalerate dehydrogenase E1 component
MRPLGRQTATLPIAPGTRLTGEQAIALFDAQTGSRHLDLAARYLRAEGHGFYTIGSAAALALRPSDPALLRYRSGAFITPAPRRCPDRSRCLT